LELWLQLSERLRTSTALVSPLVASPAFGKPVLIAPRLGQGAFRLQVTDAYGRRCAVTGERTLPALEAAHIYARAGQVADIALEPGGVRASVQGSRAKPYQVTIRMRELTAREWSAVGATIAANAWLAAMLLAGEMLEDIETAFAATGTTLFPAGARCGAVAEGRPVPVLARRRRARGRAFAGLCPRDGECARVARRALRKRRINTAAANRPALRAKSRAGSIREIPSRCPQRAFRGCRVDAHSVEAGSRVRSRAFRSPPRNKRNSSRDVLRSAKQTSSNMF
jgi:hypothetical protein